MPIPSHEALMRPLLACLADGKGHHVREFYDALANQFGLSDLDRQQLLPSGRDLLFENRVGWARTYLKKAGLIETIQRGVHRITDRGRGALQDCPVQIAIDYLKQFPEFRAFTSPADAPGSGARRAPNIEMQGTPEELLESAHERLRDNLAQELLDRLLQVTPTFFERLVVQVLVAMGYGGTLKDAGEAVGRSGDGGIDGVIKEDRLGLDAIFIQAKRWSNPVGRPEIQRFVGALQGRRASKGVFITTSTFTEEAMEYAGHIPTKVILVDGRYLTELMIDHGVGVATQATYHVKKVDSDFFSEE